MEKTTQPKKRKQNPLYQQRNEDIRHRSLVLGQSDADIAVAWGMREHTVRTVRWELGIRSSPADAPKNLNKRCHRLMTPVSTLHQQIGVKLDAHRNFVAKQAPVEFSHQMRMSYMRLRKMELGAWDFTLSELIKIADTVGIPLEELVRQANHPTWEPPKQTRKVSTH
ncbi:MAG: hypothetical protein ACK4FJ_03605 [Ferrovibrio sp.]|uniref:hypothetical protein n=1 Tax=Ferrovibrio sp. TaxID=1917215 RepID=UPI003918EEC1